MAVSQEEAAPAALLREAVVIMGALPQGLLEQVSGVVAAAAGRSSKVELVVPAATWLTGVVGSVSLAPAVRSASAVRAAAAVPPAMRAVVAGAGAAIMAAAAAVAAAAADHQVEMAAAGAAPGAQVMPNRARPVWSWFVEAAVRGPPGSPYPGSDHASIIVAAREKPHSGVSRSPKHSRADAAVNDDVGVDTGLLANRFANALSPDAYYRVRTGRPFRA